MRAANRFHFLALPIAIGSIALAACGGGDSNGGSGDAEADARDGALKFARCMREHGIDVPDPKPGAKGGIAIGIEGDEGGKQALQRAEEACNKHLKGVRGPDLSPEEESKLREDALKHARCMRENGIDMPDPTFSGGGIQQEMRGEGPGNPRFDEAQRKCSKYGRDFGLTEKGGK